MNSLVNKEILNDFYNNYIALSYNYPQPALLQSCGQRCKEIISMFKGIFPDECAQLELLLWLSKRNIIINKNCLAVMGEVVKDMQDHFGEKYKAPKIFISHAEKDKPFVEKFVAMLEQIGVKQAQMFCSSIAGYAIPQDAGDIYDYIRNEMDNDNLFVIMMLSQNYYKSAACLNEMGAAWIKQSVYQSILLPGFQYTEIDGAVNPRDMTFRLDNKEKRNYALNDLKDRIIGHLLMDDVSQNRWERIRNDFLDGIDRISESLSNESV